MCNAACDQFSQPWAGQLLANIPRESFKVRLCFCSCPKLSCWKGFPAGKIFPDFLAALHAMAWALSGKKERSKGQPEKAEGVRCERFDRTLPVVLKTLLLGIRLKLLGSKKLVQGIRGSIEPLGCTQRVRTLRKDVVLPSKHLLSAFHGTPRSKNPFKNLCPC